MMRLTFLLAVPVIMMLVTSCNLIPGGKNPAPLDQAATSGVPLQAEVVHERDVGDVEASLELNGILAEQSKAPNISVESMVNMRNKLDLTTINVEPPAPPELWINFVLKSISSFADAPVVVRAKIIREKETIATYELVLGAGANKTVFDYPINVLEGLPNVPDSLLVYAQAELLLLPAGTDPDTVNSSTATVAEEGIGHLISNPVRINFQHGTPDQ